MEKIGLKDKYGIELKVGHIIETKFGCINAIEKVGERFCFRNPVTNPNAYCFFDSNKHLNLSIQVIGDMETNPQILNS